MDPRLIHIAEEVSAHSGLAEQAVVHLLLNGWTYYTMNDGSSRWEKRPPETLVVYEKM